MTSRARKLRLLSRGSGRESRKARTRARLERLLAIDSPKGKKKERARSPLIGEQVPTEEDPRFAIRCRCGGLASGTFAGMGRGKKKAGVRCDSCELTYTVEWPR